MNSAHPQIEKFSIVYKLSKPEVIEAPAPVAPEAAFPIIEFDEPDTNASYEIPLNEGAGLSSTEMIFHQLIPLSMRTCLIQI